MEPQMSFSFNHPSRKASICGEVDGNGVFEFAIQAASDSSIRGWQLFRRMMIAFGDEVRAIHGFWRKGLLPSINIDKVNELTAAGVPLDEAVLDAWTVKQARHFGFQNVRVIGLPEGMPGAFAKVEVLIER